MKYIDKLKAKPYHEKRAYAFMVALGMTCVVALVWVSARFLVDTDAQLAKAAGPLELLVEQFSAVFGR